MKLLKPTDMFDKYQNLPCMYCKKDLFRDPEMASFGFIKDNLKKKIIEFYWACEPDCVEFITTGYEGDFTIQNENLYDILIPSNYLSWSLANQDVLYNQPGVYNEESYRNLRKLFLGASQYVFREHSLNELKRMREKSLGNEKM